MAREIVARESETGERIDKLLARRLVGQSRSSIQRLLQKGTIRVNGQLVPPRFLVKPNDRISIHNEAAGEEPRPATQVGPEPIVVFENDSVLVINKPSGLTVHPTPRLRGSTLFDWAVHHHSSIGKIGDEPKVRGGIVHRLDRDVSGVMVIAKTQESFENLKQQFQRRTVKKEYLALVHGILKDRTGTIRLKITRSKRHHGRMAALPLLGKEGTGGRPRGREAVTHYRVERVIGENTLLRLRIETGRTHQIRVHLKALGHPIVGDSVYTTKPYRRARQSLARPFLHAARLKFSDVDGTVREFTAPLPPDLLASVPT